jgi:hypothetical protein
MVNQQGGDKDMRSSVLLDTAAGLKAGGVVET